MLESFKQKQLRILYKIGCLLIGIASTFTAFYLSIAIDFLLNTFEMPIVHLVYVPIFLAYFSMFLECKLISENVKPDFLFLIGNIIGLFFTVKRALGIENINGFSHDEYVLYNLLRYFTPVIVFVVSSICIYLIRSIILQYRIAKMINYWKVQEIIEKANQEIEKNPVQNETREEHKDLLEIAHKHIGKLSDIVGKSIDPDYNREEK